MTEKNPTAKSAAFAIRDAEATPPLGAKAGTVPVADPVGAPPGESQTKPLPLQARASATAVTGLVGAPRPASQAKPRLPEIEEKIWFVYRRETGAIDPRVFARVEKVYPGNPELVDLVVITDASATEHSCRRQRCRRDDSGKAPGSWHFYVPYVPDEGNKPKGLGTGRHDVSL